MSFVDNSQEMIESTPVRPEQAVSPITLSGGDQSATYNEIKEKAICLERELQAQEEQHKAQVIHTETIGMMTKYQLVFIKLETSLNKVDLIFKQRFNFNTNYAFDKITNYRSMDMDLYKNRSKFMVLEISQRLGRMCNSINKRLKLQKESAFNKIQIIVRVEVLKNKFALEQDKIKKSFMSVIQQKDNETQTLQKKHQETSEALQIQRQKEADISNRIRQLDSMISQMENEISMNKRNQDTRGSLKTIDQRVKFLEQENQEIQEKIMTTEDSVNNFIREMSELLDSHEISTNPGDSDENMSYDHHFQPDYQSQRQYASQQGYSRPGMPVKQSSKNQKNFYSGQMTRSNRLN